MSSKKGAKCEEIELRRGPWTLEEDSLLIHYIALHGEGRWNLLAMCSGLKRTGKSCRLRWLNYLKPDVKRGNLSPEEQFLILELHAKWGNRWSRIAQYLPGRTDNEIKNYWRTRVQKQARQLKIDANSTIFRDAVRCYWMPRLLEKMAITDQSTNPNADLRILPQPQQLNNTCTELFSSSNLNTQFCGPSSSNNCSMELPELDSSPEDVLGAPYDPFVTGLDALDLATVPMPTDHIGAENDWDERVFEDGLWSMDDLCQVRKQYDYGGGIFQ